MVTYNTKITILVKEQVASFVEPMFIINSHKQATTVSVYTPQLIFCFLSLHATGIKGITLTAGLFVYNKLDPVSRVTGIPGWYCIRGIKCSDTTRVGLVY